MLYWTIFLLVIVQCQNGHVGDVAIFVKDHETEARICDGNEDNNTTKFEIIVCYNAIPSVQLLRVSSGCLKQKPPYPTIFTL